MFLAERRWIFHAGSGFWRDSWSDLLFSRQTRKGTFVVQGLLQGVLDLEAPY